MAADRSQLIVDVRLQGRLDVTLRRVYEPEAEPQR
jgi:hypothetical protein